jgi:hypothetical protein
MKHLIKYNGTVWECTVCHTWHERFDVLAKSRCTNKCVAEGRIKELEDRIKKLEANQRCKHGRCSVCCWTCDRNIDIDDGA